MTNPSPTSSEWPSNYQGCAFTARYLDSLGHPIVGSVTFTPSPVKLLDYAAATIVMPKSVTVTLDSLGQLAIVLPATDDPDVSPVHWTYLVSENFTGGTKFYTDAPQNTTVDLCNASSVPQANGAPIVRGPAGLPGGVQTVQGVADDQAGNVDLTGVVLLAADNLSELTNRAAARASLGLGDVATHSASEFATEGQVVDRLQIGNNLSDLQSPSVARNNLGLGSAATHAITDFTLPVQLQVYAIGNVPVTIPANTQVVLTGYNAKSWDEGGIGYSAGVMTVPVAGLYRWECTIVVPLGSAAYLRNLSPVTTGSGVGAYGNTDVNQENVPGPNNTQGYTRGGTLQLNAGDTIAIWYSSSIAQTISLADFVLVKQ